MKYDFIEIGTSDFRTVVESCKDQVGLCIEPIPYYLNKLPTKPNVTKANYAVSSTHEEMDIFYIKPEKIKEHKLPHWVRGCNSIKKAHPTIEKLLGDKHDEIVTIDRIQCVTWEYLIQKYDIESIDYLKIDTEGHDGVILLEYYKECIKNPNLKAKTILFENNVLRDEKLIEDAIYKFNQIGYCGKAMNQDYKLVLT